MKLENIEKKIKEQLPLIRRKYKVDSLGVFGSFVRTEQAEGSDVDILVEFREPVGLFKFMDLAEFLESLVGLKVDLVTKNALKPIMKDSILNEVVYL